MGFSVDIEWYYITLTGISDRVNTKNVYLLLLIYQIGQLDGVFYFIFLPRGGGKLGRGNSHSQNLKIFKEK